MFDSGRIGRSIRVIRIRAGWRQQDLANRAGVSRSFVSKVETGQAATADMARIQRLCAAIGADLDVRVRWHGEGLDRLPDEAHATIVQGLVALLSKRGWQVWLEVTFNVYGERGSIDVLGWHPPTRTLLVGEVKSVIADAQGTLAPLDRKVRLGARIARERGLDPAVVGRLLVVADRTTNRRRIARFGELFGAALPATGWAVRHWLAGPAGALAGLMFLSDSPASNIRRVSTGRIRVNRARKGVTTIQ